MPGVATTIADNSGTVAAAVPASTCRTGVWRNALPSSSALRLAPTMGAGAESAADGLPATLADEGDQISRAGHLDEHRTLRQGSSHDLEDFVRQPG